MPRVSVIIPCYNHGAFIQETIDSVIAQTYSDWEIIIVNDGSTDKSTIRTLTNIHLTKVKLINTPNQGLGAARNTGIRHASGEIILPLDSDDKLEPHYIEKALKVMDQNVKIGLVNSIVRYFGERNGIMPIPPYSPGNIFLWNCFSPSSLFYRRDCEKTEGFDAVSRSGFEDWDFWVSILELGVLAYRIPEVLFFYRYRKNSMFRTLSEDHKFNAHLQILLKHKEFFWSNLESVLHQVYRLNRGIFKKLKEDMLLPLLKIASPLKNKT